MGGLPLDQLIELGPNAGAWQTQEHSHVLMEVCRAFGDKLTKEQIVKMTQRGEAYSRAGLYGLTVLYDDWPDSIAEYHLGDYFDQQEVFDIAWYCRFREFHQGKSSMDLWGSRHSDLQTKFATGFGILEITDDNLDYVYSKWPNRGDSAYLDCLTKA
jgi:hypothetical protein